MWRLARDLLDEIVQHKAMAAGERFDKPGNLFRATSLQSQAGKL
jgi:hypothetical protein